MTAEKKQKITYEDVEHIAHLARIKLTPSEIKKFTKQLEAIIEYFDTLSEIETKDVKETSQVTGILNSFRQDLAQRPLSQKEALQNAPEEKNGYFRTFSGISDTKNDKS